jgi:hypothetical protein
MYQRTYIPLGKYQGPVLVYNEAHHCNLCVKHTLANFNFLLIIYHKITIRENVIYFYFHTAVTMIYPTLGTYFGYITI